MKQVEERYISLLTDFGFKRIYSTFPIREQAPKGSEWDFRLNHVYTVALLNFNMYEDAFDKEKTRHHVQLCNTGLRKQDGEISLSYL